MPEREYESPQNYGDRDLRDSTGEGRAGRAGRGLYRYSQYYPEGLHGPVRYIYPEERSSRGHDRYDDIWAQPQSQRQNMQQPYEGESSMGVVNTIVQPAAVKEGETGMGCNGGFPFWGAGLGGYNNGAWSNDGIAELILSNNVSDSGRDVISAVSNAKGDILAADRQAELITLDAINRNGSDSRESTERNGSQTRELVASTSFETRDIIRDTATAQALASCNLGRQLGEVKFELSRQLAECCCEMKEMMVAQELQRVRDELQDAKAVNAVNANNSVLIDLIKALGLK